MNAERTDEQALFNAAAQLTGLQREAFLAAACQDDPGLRQRLKARLAAQDQVGGVPPSDSQPELVATVVSEAVPNEEAGLLIGRYKLLGKLGGGGFGTVWLAEQKEPVRRKVALKIIKLSMDKVNDEVKNAFFEDLTSDTSGDQFIILENTGPPEALIAKMHYHPFTKNPESGRYGFFPLPASESSLG